MDINTGTTLVSNLNQQQLVIDMEASVHKMYNDSFPFEAITRTIGGIEKVTRMKHEYREDRLQGISTVTTAAAAASATSISVQSPKLGGQNMLVYSPATGEMFAMDEDVGGTAVAGAIKVRGLTSASGTGITTAIPAGSPILFLLEAHAEGDAAPPAFYTTEDAKFTYIQQFDEKYEQTDITNYEKKYGEDERSKQLMKKWIGLKQRINLMMYVGSAFRETASASSGARRHGMAGLFSYCSAREIDASQVPGGFTLQTLGNILRPTRQYGKYKTPPVLLSGQNLWNGISAFPSGTVRITDPGAKDITFGVTIARLNTPFGEINVSYDQMLSQEYGLADRAAMIQPEEVKQLEMTGMPLQLKTNVQNPTEIHIFSRDIYTGTRGMVTYLPELHRTIKGVI